MLIFVCVVSFNVVAVVIVKLVVFVRTVNVLDVVFVLCTVPVDVFVVDIVILDVGNDVSLQTSVLIGICICCLTSSQITDFLRSCRASL